MLEYRKLNTLTSEHIDQTILNLKTVFGFSASRVELFNDLPKYCIYAVNTYYSINQGTIKALKDLKASITFIDFDNEGLRLLVRVRN